MLSKEEIEKAKEELKIIWKETDFENSKRRIAIETVLQALEKLQKHCKEMIKEKQELTSALLDSVPKKKIENEIEILKEQCGGNIFHIQQTLNAKIRLLQKLLEDK